MYNYIEFDYRLHKFLCGLFFVDIKPFNMYYTNIIKFTTNNSEILILRSSYEQTKTHYIL